MTRTQARRKSHTARSAIVILAAVFGVLAATIGVMIYLDGSEAGERHRSITLLPNFQVATSGQIAFLEGRVASSTPVLRNGFVAYQRRRHERRGTVLLGGQVQPIGVEATQGTVSIINNTYVLDKSTQWSFETKAESPADWTTGAIEIFGIAPGSPIFVQGTVETPGPSGRFTALTVAAGTRERYLANLAVQRDSWLATILIVLAQLLLAYALWDGRRILKEP